MTHDVGEMLKGVLGDATDGGLLICFDPNNHEFVLCALDSERVPDTLVSHPDWDEFLRLVSNYSDTNLSGDTL